MKEQIRQIVLSNGADICGFADAGRFEEAPSGFRPTDIFPACKSVVSFAVALPAGLAKVDPRLIYGHYNAMSFPQMDGIAIKSAKMMEERFGCSAVPMPIDDPYEYWDSGNMEGRGLLSMKHAAALAGLGRLGKSTLLLNARYGNMLSLGAILTDLELACDPMAEDICISSCGKCIDACPVRAIGGGTVNQKLCRTYTYGKNVRGFATVACNRCRTVCPVNDNLER